MTTDLRAELHDLAERRPAAVPPPDLWRRGVRRRRRVRAVAAGVTAAAVAAGVLLTTVGLDAVRTAEPAPLDGSGPAAIPDRLHTPSPWLEGTAGNPPGPLAVIAGAERRTGWRGTSGNGWAGVSASTGEYRFLDLPGAAEPDADDVFGSEADPALSPDGRAVAYWLAHPENPRWVGGWAVYDTVSGDVVRHRVGSRLGLFPETMAWTGAGTVLVEYSMVTQRDGGSFGGRGRPMVLWSPETGELVEVPGDDPIPVSSVWPTERGVATVDGKKVVLRDAETGRADLSFKVRTSRDVGAGTVNPDVTAVAFLPHTPDSSVRRLLVGEVPPDVDGGVVPTTGLPVDLDLYHVIGWQDPVHVLVRGAFRTPEAWHGAVYAVDVRTGDHQLLVSETRENWIGTPDYADALWERPTVSRPAPDRAYDPRLLVGAGGLLVGGLALLVVRRRRARG